MITGKFFGCDNELAIDSRSASPATVSQGEGNKQLALNLFRVGVFRYIIFVMTEKSFYQSERNLVSLTHVYLKVVSPKSGIHCRERLRT